MRATLWLALLATGCGKAVTEGRVRDEGRVEAPTAVALGLSWLAAHQDADGRWDAKDYMKHDPEADRCDGAGNPLYDVGLSALATLAFLGAGLTDRGSAAENPHALTVRQGLRYLMSQQAPDGCFGSRRAHVFMYNHVTATLAMCEAFARTRNPRYEKPAKDGIAFILAAQNPGAGWRYEPRGGESDTSVTVWCVSALAAGRRAGLAIPQQAFDDAVRWVDRMTEPNFGRVGYNYPGGTSSRYEGINTRFPPANTEAMTAAGMWIRFLAGAAASDAAIAKGTKICLSTPLVWGEGTTDVYYWYFGTLALAKVGGEARSAWNEKILQAVAPRQRVEGARKGSWDPLDPWGLNEGGRIYSTALLTMCLEETVR